MSVRNFLMNALIFFAGMLTTVVLVFLSTTFLVAHVLLAFLVKYGIFTAVFLFVICIGYKVYRFVNPAKS
jgi:DMSO/TMAO reductase YedYZ heme-binding membrane subunit